ncbi:hypothetical protein [Azohydromonas australica]|uniref:hypothetical protein n=1 Tax=Azohydromonas australica TaxID=364039 RepID=UPI0003FB4C1F|nr:hypothetical protein [Azohydromonas australica]
MVAPATVRRVQAATDTGLGAATHSQVGDFVRGEDRIDLTALIDAAAAITAPRQLCFADGALYGNTDAAFSLALARVTALSLSDLVLAR